MNKKQKREIAMVLSFRDELFRKEPIRYTTEVIKTLQTRFRIWKRSDISEVKKTLSRNKKNITLTVLMLPPESSLQFMLSDVGLLQGIGLKNIVLVSRKKLKVSQSTSCPVYVATPFNRKKFLSFLNEFVPSE